MTRIRTNRVCFTLNNYEEEDVVQWMDMAANYEKHGIVFAIVGQEIGASGTPHLQGFVHVSADPKVCGIKFWKDFLPGGKRAHIETAHGTDTQSEDYCTKEGPFIKMGEAGSNTAESIWTRILKACEEGDVEAVKEVSHEYFIKYNSQIMSIIEKRKRPKMDRSLKELRPWQEEVLNLINNQNDREILFVVDEEGGKGKSVLTGHLLSTRKTWACQGKLIATRRYRAGS